MTFTVIFTGVTYGGRCDARNPLVGLVPGVGLEPTYP